MLIFGALNTDELYMMRCLQLAQLAAGHTAPNPMVGAVLVHQNNIIGEGYHQQYGKAHAEVNCINSVAHKDLSLVEKSTLYVSLEPCSHFGKTPPCADLIIEKKIHKVVIGCRDTYQPVNGKGISKLRSAGIEVVVGVLEKEAKEINKRFFIFHQQQRPYIILKWAQSNNYCIANADYSAVKISNAITDRTVHRWRSEEAAVMAGTNTALYDNPSLTNRLWNGKNPVRIVIDKDLKIPLSNKIFEGETTVVFNLLKQEDTGNVLYRKINDGTEMLPQLLLQLYTMNIQSVLIEGGTVLLQSFIDAAIWDEARVITNNGLIIKHGIKAPVLHHHQLMHTETYLSDYIQYYNHPHIQ